MTRPFAVRRAMLTVQGKDPGVGDVLRRRASPATMHMLAEEIRAVLDRLDMESDPRSLGEVGQFLDAAAREADGRYANPLAIREWLDEAKKAAERASPRQDALVADIEHMYQTLEDQRPDDRPMSARSLRTKRGEPDIFPAVVEFLVGYLKDESKPAYTQAKELYDALKERPPKGMLPESLDLTPTSAIPGDDDWGMVDISFDSEAAAAAFVADMKAEGFDAGEGPPDNSADRQARYKEPPPSDDFMDIFSHSPEAQALTVAGEDLRDAVDAIIASSGGDRIWDRLDGVNLSIGDPDGHGLGLADVVVESVTEEATPAEYAKVLSEMRRDLLSEQTKLARVLKDVDFSAGFQEVVAAIDAAISFCKSQGGKGGKGRRRSAAGRLETKAGKVKPGGGEALLLLQQANSDLNDALDAVENAVTSVKDAIASLRRVEGTGVLPGNLQAYLLPWLQTMIDGDRGGGIYLDDAIEQVDMLIEEYDAEPDDDADDGPSAGLLGLSPR